MSIWKNDNENRNAIRIISDRELDLIAPTITFTGTINLRVKPQPVIKGSTFRKLFKLKQNHEEKF